MRSRRVSLLLLITNTPYVGVDGDRGLLTVDGWGFLDVDINFDLCQDSGAAAALFGSSGTQQVNGTAAIVHCSEEWTGGANVCLPGVESC